RILLDKDILEQQRSRYGAAHAKGIPIADDGNALGLCGYRKVKRVAARRLLAFGDLGAEHAVVIRMAGERCEDFLAVDDPPAFDRLRLRAEGDAARGRRAAF